MINYLKFFLNCKNKELYSEFARRYNTTTLNVYRIAHGGKTKSWDEDAILHELINLGILSGIKFKKE